MIPRSPARWSVRRSRTSHLWAAACLALVSSSPARGDVDVPRRPIAPALTAGAASALGVRQVSSPEVVLAAQRVVEAEARAREAALPRLRLAPLGGGTPAELVPFGVDGAPRPGAMDELARLLAPHGARDEEPQPIDPRLPALLLRISDELGGVPLTVVSGHRKPGRGTRRTSFHVRGMAVDIAVAGVRPREVRDAAIRAGAGGVGLYRAFVHVDVRDEPYRWGGGGGGRSARRGG